uniref:Uncharacterized protein n=1 Tax=Oryza rufipogon TaxID=4529 RepID=A0A0E0RCZ9_ORYRU
MAEQGGIVLAAGCLIPIPVGAAQTNLAPQSRAAARCANKEHASGLLPFSSIGLDWKIRPGLDWIGLISSFVDEDPLYGCQTPRESIFDPFAPGPKELACAPKKNVIKAPELPPRRQLSFDSGDYPVKRLSFEFDDAEEDDQFLERICKMFIDLIVSNQALETTGKDLIGSNSLGSCETSSSEPLLTSIAYTCPDVPLRRPLKAVQLSPSICRKLDFDSVSPRCLFVKENK